MRVRKSALSSKTGNALTSVAYALMCAQDVGATRRGSNANASSLTETRSYHSIHLSIQKLAEKSREQSSTKVSVESDLCVPCYLPRSAQFPRVRLCPSWFSAQVSQLLRNSHKLSNANSRHLGKSSLPNSCIFPFSHLTLVFSPSVVSPCCWKKSLVGRFVVSSQSRLPRLGVGPGTPGFQSLPRYGLEIHHWVSKVSLQSSWIRSKNTIRHSSSVLWLWTSGVKVYHCAHSSSLHQKTEVGRFTQDQHRFGSLQRLWRSPNVLVKQFEAAHSRASYEPRILHVRSPSSQISVNSGPVSFKAGQGYGRKETSCNTLALSLTVVLVASSIRNYLELDRKESLRQGCLHCSQWISGQRCWSQQARPLGME